MYPNGCAHEVVDDDQQGMRSIIQWLSFVLKTTNVTPDVRISSDPVNRDVAWKPTPAPLTSDSCFPELMMHVVFFYKDSYKHYHPGWGKSVGMGCGCLGGTPMGAIAVETCLVERIIPANPADPNSREAVMPQAGQVLFPDTSYKTAQALRDFNNEGLPVMIFANWRGLSGGSRDMLTSSLISQLSNSFALDLLVGVPSPSSSGPSHPPTRPWDCRSSCS